MLLHNRRDKLNYLAIICDIRGSRGIPNRKEVQYLIINMLKEANKIFSDIIVCPFAITAGDEWEGLLYEKCNYENLLNFFEITLKDIKFCCGIGKGELTIDDFSLPANQLDGPAFYLARKAITLAKERDIPVIYLNKDEMPLYSI